MPSSVGFRTPGWRSTLEEVARPLDGVLDLVGKILQRAYWDGLLGRVARGPIRLGHTRHDDLHVALWPQRARLEQRFLIIDTPLVDVKARLHIVESVAHARERFPKGVIEDLLGVGPDPIEARLNLSRRVHLGNGRCGTG
eukprot:scaffold110152_cov29-Tisochrysis_lutea.AAC.2